MKDTLEYKILKYLSENNDGNLKNIDSFNNNDKDFSKILRDLKDKEFIYLNRVIKEKSLINEAKIKLNGLDKLNEIERKIINNDIDDLTLKKLKFEQFPVKFWWLILIISGAISILTTLVNNQISKSINQQEPQVKEKSLPK